MTFILAIKTVNGILVGADSLEVQEGAFSRWDEYAELLTNKSLKENDTSSQLSPAEVSAIFKPERIKNKKGAQKLFPIASNAVLLIAGLADINSKTVDEICISVYDQLQTLSNPSHLEINDVVFDTFKTELDADQRPQEDKESCHHILCVRENGKTFIYSLCYWLKVGTTKKEYSWVSDDYLKRIIYVAGSIGMASGANEINKFREARIPTPHMAFRIAQNLMSLSILTEELLQEIPGVGGDIYYGMLTDSGFKFILSETDALNSMLE